MKKTEQNAILQKVIPSIKRELLKEEWSSIYGVASLDRENKAVRLTFVRRSKIDVAETLKLGADCAMRFKEPEKEKEEPVILISSFKTTAIVRNAKEAISRAVRPSMEKDRKTVLLISAVDLTDNTKSLSVIAYKKGKNKKFIEDKKNEFKELNTNGFIRDEEQKAKTVFGGEILDAFHHGYRLRIITNKFNKKFL